MSSADVRIDSGGCSLAATYLEAAEPAAAALLIQGSGRTDRNSDVRLPGGRKLRAAITWAVAEALDAIGVSTLRFDKRGVGASEGTYYAAQLGAGGQAAGIVLLSGPARPGGDVLTYQVAELADRIPASAKLILRFLRTDVVRAQRKNLAKILASQSDVIRLSGQRVGARWVRDFVAYDPAPVLARVTVPVLAITGAHDLQVPPSDVEVMGRLVKGPFEGHVVPDVSHLLRRDPGSVGPRGYRWQARQPVSPEVLGLITDWVASNWARS